MALTARTTRGGVDGRVWGGWPRPAVALLLSLLAAPLPVQAMQGLQGRGDAVADAVAAARRGGVVLLCRHAATDDFREIEPVDYDDPSTQRRLSDEGRRQSVAMGRDLRALGVQVSEVVASPMERARETAELLDVGPVRIDTVWHTNGGRYDGPARDARRAALATPVPRGVRLIVSHIGTMSSVLPEGLGNVGEGDCVVGRPAAGGLDVIAVVPGRAWRAAYTVGSTFVFSRKRFVGSQRFFTSTRRSWFRW